MIWLSLLLAAAYGVLGMRALTRSRNLWHWTFIVAAGIPLGLGTSGLMYLALPAFHLAVDAVLLLATGYLAWRTNTEAEAWPGFQYNWILAAAAVIAMAFVFASIAAASAANPHGDWDAWAIWNLRAKYLAGPVWQHAVATEIAVQHPDYPLLLSALIARAWKDGGTNNFDPALPSTLATLFFACGAALLASAAACIRKSSSLGWLSLLVLATSAGFISQVPSQYADIPLGVYMAAAVACALLDMPLAGGLFAGLAANTKNEGIAFAVAYTVAMLVRSRRPAVLFGALPGLAAIGIFKIAYAPASEYAGRTPDFSRLGAIVEAALKSIPDLGFGLTNPLLLLLILIAGLRIAKNLPQARIWWACAAVFLVMKFSYLAAYLMTPADVKWQLGTSLSRLTAQLWLMLILLVLVRLRSLEEVFAVSSESLSSRKKQPKG